MKWLLFLLLIMFSCKNKKERKQIPPELITVNPNKITGERIFDYNDTVDMPSMTDSDYDTGYFKGYIPAAIDSIEYTGSSHLFQFLSNTISKKDIILVNKETLSHSVFIDQKNKIRYDTLRNKYTTLTSVYKFGNKETQKIYIDGILLKKIIGINYSIIDEAKIDFDAMSFRYFSFRGNEYYYIRAGSFYSVGSSMGNVNYNLVYSLKQKRLTCFETCRLGLMLFGDVNGDEKLDYLDFDNSDFCITVPWSDTATIRLYSCNEKGNFILQKDLNGKPYFIQGNTGEGFTQDSFRVKNSYWPFKLKN